MRAGVLSTWIPSQAQMGIQRPTYLGRILGTGGILWATGDLDLHRQGVATDNMRGMSVGPQSRKRRPHLD